MVRIFQRSVLVVMVLGGSLGCKRHRSAPDAGAGAGVPSVSVASLEPLPAPLPLISADAGTGSDLLDVVALAKAKTFTSFQAARRTPETVFKLDLSKQDLLVLPGIQKLTRLQSLDLSHNAFKDVTSLTALKRLQRLDLSFNPLRRLPVDLGQLTELESLDVSQTPELATLPIDIAKLQKLKVLRVGGERIKRLPDELTELASLTVLSLHGCTALTALPDGMAKLRALTDLDLTRTGLPEAEFDRLKALLPGVKILGIPGEADPQVAEDANADEAHQAELAKGAVSLSELPCSEVLEKGRAQYVTPLAEDDDAERLVEGTESDESPLGKVVSRYVRCREEADRVGAQLLPPRVEERLNAVRSALAAFEEAREAVGDTGDTNDARDLVARLTHEAERADVMNELLRVLRESSGGVIDDGDAPVVGALYKVQKGLVDLEASAGEAGAAYATLKEKAGKLTSAVRPLTERAQSVVYRRMETVLRE